MKHIPHVSFQSTENYFQNIELVSIPEKGHEISYKNTELVIPYIIQLINQIEE